MVCYGIFCSGQFVKTSIIIGYVYDVTFRNQRLNYHRRWYPKSDLKGLEL